MKVPTISIDASNNVDSYKASQAVKAAAMKQTSANEPPDLSLHTSNYHTASEQETPFRPTISREEAVRLAILKTG